MTSDRIAELRQRCDTATKVGQGRLGFVDVEDLRQLLSLAEDAERMREANRTSWRIGNIVHCQFDTNQQAVMFWKSLKALTAPAAGASDE